MTDPEVTAVLGRRFLAFVIDSALAAVAGIGVAYQQSVAFDVVGRDASDSPLVDPANFDEMTSLLDFELFGRSEIFGISLVRAQEIGDSVRVFGADSYRFGTMAAVVVALVVFWLIPTFTQRTIGMIPVDLTILDRDGGEAGAIAHVQRTLFGVIDLFPVIIPGLLGMIAAATTPLHQRVGDRIAGTVVVDRTTAAFKARDEHPRPISLDLTPAPSSDDAEPASVEATAQSAPIRVETLRAQPVNGLRIADAPGPVSAPGQAPIIGGSVAPAEPTTAAEGTEEQREATDDPRPTDQATDDLLPPPPVHRRQRAVDTPAPHTRDGNEVVADRGDAASTTEQEIEAGAAAADPLARLESWQPPRSEPAPVWQPTSLEPAPVESPDPHDGRTLDDVRLGGISGLITADAFDPGQASSEQGDSAQPDDRQVASRPPVWSDKWRAWMYWDATQKCWLRHDTESNRWIPID